MSQEIPQLPLAFMNDDHAHGLELIHAMTTTLANYPDDRVPLARSCEDFLNHCREHFEREEDVMRASGFPPYPMHKGEHDQVLAWLEALLTSIAAGGGAENVRQAVENDIPTWFFQHIQSMDKVTANWVAARQPSGVSI